MLEKIRKIPKHWSRIKIENLDRGDIIYVYNPMSDSFSELELVRHTADDTTRFRLTGNEFCDVPEDCMLIPSVKLIPETMVDGSVEYRIEKRNILSYNLWRCKQLVHCLIFSDLAS